MIERVESTVSYYYVGVIQCPTALISRLFETEKYEYSNYMMKMCSLAQLWMDPKVVPRRPTRMIRMTPIFDAISYIYHSLAVTSSNTHGLPFFPVHQMMNRAESRIPF